MAQTKPLFVPWLCEQIQSGRYPGVNWINEEKTKFSIPWKHALRQDSNSDDVLIFKAWAQTSTTGDGRTHGDPSVWKRNFRSALRAKGFKMVLDNKNDAANPHKVYQFPTDSQCAVSEGSQETDDSQELYLGEDEAPNVQPHGLEQCFYDLNLQESPSQVWNRTVMGMTEQDLYQATSPCSEPQCTRGSATEMVHFPIQETQTPLCLARGTICGLEQIVPSEGATAMSHFSATEGIYLPDGEHVGDHVAGTGATNTLETYFQIKVYYKGKIVFDGLLENDMGFRLMYQESMDSSASDLPVLKLPSPDENIQDQVQATLTKKILENMGGLEIRRVEGVVYGHRWGSSRIFWGQCKHEKSLTARELSKNTPEPIYLFKDYISGLKEFIEKRTGPCPSYTLFFCLGEKWPDPKMNPWEKKLIMIEVVLTSLEALKTMAIECGASSLQSMELQISLDQMMELC